jgi:trypsin
MLAARAYAFLTAVAWNSVICAKANEGLATSPSSNKQETDPGNLANTMNDSTRLRKPTPFIINGNEAKFEEFPYFVQILDRQAPGMCGGSLMNPNTIITAAHCLQDVKDITKIEAKTRHDNQTVFGAKVYFPTASNFKPFVGAASVTPKQGSEAQFYDVAVLITATPFKNAKTVELDLNPDSVKVGDSVVTAGTGLNEKGKDTTGWWFSKMSAPVGPAEQCKNLYEYFEPDFMYCVDTTKGQATGQGNMRHFG